MAKEGGFDDAKVADLAKQIQQQLAAVETCRKVKGQAESALGSAEVRLANLRAEFTRAIDGQLDMSTLKQRAPERHQVPHGTD